MNDLDYLQFANTIDFEKELVRRAKEIDLILNDIRKKRQVEPDGNLRIGRSNGKMQYYQVIDSKDTCGRYLKKNQESLIKALAQKNYNKKLESALLNEKKEIIRLLNAQTFSKANKVYDELSQTRKHFVRPYVMSDEEFSGFWVSEVYEKNQYYPEELMYETKKGERVRAKSEMIIADIYYELGIPYRYEAKLQLENGMYKYPDFTVLDVRNRKIYYHEHLGLLDKEEYRNENMKKIELYRDNGIYTGKNLIITFETKFTPINYKSIRRMIKDIFDV